MASFSERYPYCAKLKLNQDSIQNPNLTLLKRCKKNHAVLNGLLLELYKYRKEKKLPWSTINELATIILHTPVEIKQLQQTLYKMRKHEEKLLKKKKRTIRSISENAIYGGQHRKGWNRYKRISRTDRIKDS